MKRYEYVCDAASLKILADGGELIYSNNFGDGMYDVYICKKEDIPKIAHFKGQFIISKEGWLMHFDCDWDFDADVKQKQYRFTKGIYSVYLDCETCNFYIYKIGREKGKKWKRSK